MQVVPVIDVKNGLVVHATGGAREHYRPIESPLSAGAEPRAVVEGLLSVFPFEALYVADLDAIAGGANNLDALIDVCECFPALQLWVDDGCADAAAACARVERSARWRPVIGSETLVGVGDLAEIRGALPIEPLLSLDFKGDQFVGPANLLATPAAWPSRVIAMTLAAVGARAGPDLDRVRQLKAAAPAARIVAAGGVRDKADLVALAEAGAAAALVATALHSGTLKAGDLVEIAGLRPGSIRS